MEIVMPESEKASEGTVTRWLKGVGDPVSPGELVCEVAVDKVDIEVSSPSGGYLAKILAGEGDIVPVGAPLAVVSEADPGSG